MFPRKNMAAPSSPVKTNEKPKQNKTKQRKKEIEKLQKKVVS
jgi:hypothetical protein